MPSPLVVTGPAANSLGTLAEAHVYFGNRFGASKWTNAVPDDQCIAMLMAFDRLEVEDFEGSRTVADQGAPFPRKGIHDRDGNSVDSAVTPEFAKEAQYELALLILKNRDWFDDRGTEGWRQFGVGAEGGMTPNHEWRAQELPEIVKRKLRSVLRWGEPKFLVA